MVVIRNKDFSSPATQIYRPLIKTKHLVGLGILGLGARSANRTYQTLTGNIDKL